MEFLDINYAEVKPKEVDSNFLNGILFLVDKGLESKDLQDPVALSAELDEKVQKQITAIGETKPNTQDKAIVSALFNRYPKMLEDKSDVKEFKEHLTNLFKAKEMTDGSIKYLIERLMQPDTLEKGSAPAPVQQAAPQVQQQPAANTKQQSQAQVQPQESNNSEEDENFFEEWFSSYDVESELTEDEFSSLLDECNDCNDSSKEVLKLNPARKFIKAKLMDKELSSDGINEGFRRAATFIIRKESEYHGVNMMAMAPTKDHNDGYQIGDEIIKVSKDKAKSFMLDKRGNLVTKSMEQPNIDK